ncbi:tyrosine-type recombinase/integrase [Porifericola rhodea]|uniref:tyrosine-type recombinase/integrase n=1 Tax=Porifericola rhodea TaxID=930972 RepID=UPI00266713F5|nr:tyrosine-type recombinase/integrase [Porifericola rhodea]WKN29948.1 tyrosine-type recombinase/integrase [Porifericola rhodea]
MSRYIYTTTLLNDDVPIHVIQENFGHKDMRTTRRYAKRLNFGSLDKVNENLPG